MSAAGPGPDPSPATTADAGSTASSQAMVPKLERSAQAPAPPPPPPPRAGGDLGWLAAVVGALGALGVLFFWPTDYCHPAERAYGIRVPLCPDGTPRQIIDVEAASLRRNGQGVVWVAVRAAYTTGPADQARTAHVTSRRVAAHLSLVGPDGHEQPLPIVSTSHSYYGDRQGMGVRLPEVPDGDYVLRTHVRSPLGTGSQDLPLPVYAPARIHVLTDRPLYEPGNEVKLRALALRARDFTPIDDRPGTWVVEDPEGEVVLEERAPAGAWGVASGSLPLDSRAPTGNWTVRWRSGDDEGTAQFRVAPFTLPRFRVEAEPSKSFYRPGDRPSVAGSVTYSSGAPVANALVALEWWVDGAWPPPTSWMEGELPRQVSTDGAGRFTLELPEVPQDLQGRATLRARLVATDEAGDRVSGGLGLLLSEDAVQASTVTELADGLVEGINNRLYLRVTRADGLALAGAKIRVTRAWDPGDPGVEARLDADSVARLQLDPGQPVSIEVPPLPVRPPPRAPGPPVAFTSTRDLVGQGAPNMPDRVAMDRWLADLEACGKWVTGGPGAVTVGLRVAASGAVVATTGVTSRLSECVQATLRGRRLPAGSERLYELTVRVMPPDLPVLESYVEGTPSVDDELVQLVDAAARDARDCLPPAPWREDTTLPWVLEWRVQAGSRQVSSTWIRTAEAMPAGAAACVTNPLAGLSLAEPATRSLMGVVRYVVRYPGHDDLPTPQPRIMMGYELMVSVVDSDDQVIGDTRLRMEPGEIPRLRLRAEPVLARPGDKVTFTLLRGPSFTGSVPKSLVLRPQYGISLKVEIDPDSRAARYTIPANARGWITAEVAGERALVYVQSDQELELSITPDAARYRPGEEATLAIETRIGGAGAAAAVGLVGVDQSLGQLVPLPGPDALGALRPRIEMSAPAFAALDAQALTQGRIHGRFAAEAVVLRVTEVPTPAELDAVIHASISSDFDPVVELTDHFYGVLAELATRTRAWERDAPDEETMQPATMAGLWSDALEAVAARGEPVEDAYGRRLRLHRLPPDLLELTSPRALVINGTRLPEDMENWPDWVRRNRP
ncbi:MG2 domain-containing protein [Haliangium sp.]|uniref:MG2 domain-containing protein n=1 Tax=Haliangium sp. TaxID=2663208 RepID=UPI003D130ADF